jgi:predicted lipoprotein with Yx(FWY)xxD motif
MSYGNKTFAFSLLIALAMIAAACAPTAATTTEAPAAQLPETGATATQASSPTPQPTATSAPTSTPVPPVLEVSSNPDLGDLLVDSQGMSVYVFTNDEPGLSNCYDQCTENWPAVTVEAGAALNAPSQVSAELGAIERQDGAMQLTVNNLPLYTFAHDAAPGDVNGQGVGSVWFVLDPSGEMVTTPLPGAIETEAPTSASTEQPPLITTSQEPNLGAILTDNQGMTLYAFTVDSENTSNCYDQCEQNWPPLTVEDESALDASSEVNAALGATQRQDGAMQVTVNGMPVYHFFQDSSPGDVNGQGVGQVWFVLNGSGEIVMPASQAAPTETASSPSYDDGYTY